MMYDRPPIDSQRTAIVVVDMVNWMFTWRSESPVGSNPGYEHHIKSVVIPNNLRLIEAGRKTGAKIIFLRVGASSTDFRDAVPGFRRLFETADAYEGSEAFQLIDDLTVEDDDLVVNKVGSGGFTSSALDLHLRRFGIEHVIYTGVASNACVLLTAMAGFDLGYHGYIVTDATAAKTPEMHEVALTVTADFFALGVTTQAMIELLTDISDKN